MAEQRRLGRADPEAASVPASRQRHQEVKPHRGGPPSEACGEPGPEPRIPPAQCTQDVGRGGSFLKSPPPPRPPSCFTCHAGAPGECPPSYGAVTLQPGIWGSSRKQEKTVSTAAGRPRQQASLCACVEHVGHVSGTQEGPRPRPACLTEPAVVFTK